MICLLGHKRVRELPVTGHQAPLTECLPPPWSVEEQEPASECPSFLRAEVREPSREWEGCIEAPKPLA